MKRNPTKRSPEGQQALDEFRDRWEWNPCWGCGEHWIPFERHHIVYRDGVKGMDDQRNLAHLCKMCHDVHHNHGIQTWHGIAVKVRLTKEDVLRLKKQYDPEHWDLAFLRLLAGPGDGRLNMEFGRGLE